MKTLYTKKQVLDAFTATPEGSILSVGCSTDAKLFQFEKKFEIWCNKHFDYIGKGVWRVVQ